MRKSNVVYEIEDGSRTIMGTCWPIVDQVRREGPREWVAVIGLCNGIAFFSRTFNTRRKAIDYASGKTSIAVDPEDE